jgi:hypothetical protein
MQQSPDDRFRADDDELISPLREISVRPDQNGNAGAICEIKSGKIHHEHPRTGFQGAADDAEQMVPVGRV